MPNYTFSVFKADTGTNLSTFTNKKEHYSTVNISTTAETYVSRFLAVAGLSSTALSTLSAGVNLIDGLGYSYS